MHRPRFGLPGGAVLLLTVSILIAPQALAGQEVVESAAPRDPDLRLADEPLLRVGIVDGPLEYIFGNVMGAVRLEDGGIVVADEQSGNIRRFDSNGRHLWTSGRSGEGPGEYKGLRLLRNCPGAPLTVFDWSLDRITELDLDGHVLATRSLLAAGVRPYNDPLCAPDGRLVYTPWPDDMGESCGPRWWGRDMVFAAAGAGVWYGTADDYELEQLNWTGRVVRVARWAGPDLTVTDERVDSYRESWLARYDDAEARRNFEREVWPDIREQLPERFPAYEALIALPDGAFWVKAHAWRAPGEELHLLDANGVWLRRLMIPGGVVLDAGRDWVLLSQRDQLGVPTVALYGLVAN